jgi:excisionase family DNA binding protein
MGNDKPREQSKLSEPAPDRLMTVPEAADYLRIHVGTVYKLASQNRIPACHVHGALRFSRPMLDDYLRATATGVAK